MIELSSMCPKTLTLLNLTIPRHSPGLRVLLARGELLVLNRAVGERVECCRGRLWVTQEGDTTDYDVRDRFTVNRPGRIVVQAQIESELVIRGRK